MKKSYALLKQYFKDNSVVKANIESFNHFIEKELKAVIDENKEIEPTIIPTNVDEFKIRLDNVWVTFSRFICVSGKPI